VTVDRAPVCRLRLCIRCKAASGRPARLEPGRPTMSYRAFKRLLGETSLERKCRFLFGGFILLLITGSFGLYARLTEDLAYDQLPTTCKLLVNHIVARQIATACRPRDERDAQATRAMEEFRRTWEEPWPKSLRKYDFIFITPSTSH